MCIVYKYYIKIMLRWINVFLVLCIILPLILFFLKRITRKKEKKVGVSIHTMGKKIDKGILLAQKVIKIEKIYIRITNTKKLLIIKF